MCLNHVVGWVSNCLSLLIWLFWLNIVGDFKWLIILLFIEFLRHVILKIVILFVPLWEINLHTCGEVFMQPNKLLKKGLDRMLAMVKKSAYGRISGFLTLLHLSLSPLELFIHKSLLLVI